MFSRSLRRLANQVLDEIPGYDGYLGSLEIRPLRGEYTLRDAYLQKAGVENAPPFLQVQRAGAHIAGRALRRRMLALRVYVDRPRINLIAARGADRSQLGIDPSWPKRLKTLFPVRIDSLRINDASLHVSIPDAQPPVDLQVDDIRITGQNLTNREHLREQNFATWNMTGRFMGEGRVTAEVHSNLQLDAPAFRLQSEIRDLPLTTLNDFLHAYANLHVHDGVFSADADITLQNRMVGGMVEAFYTDLRVSRWNEGRNWSLFKRLRHGMFSRGMDVLENRDRTLAVRIPVQGSLGDLSIDLPTAVASVLKNAFLQALEPGIGHAASRSRKPWVATRTGAAEEAARGEGPS